MEYIKAYVLSVAGVMVASTLIEAIMPATSFKKYIKTALGLVILITLAKPVLKLSDFDKLMEKYISFENTVDFSDKQAFAEEQTDKIIKAEFEKNLCKTIKDDVKNNLSKDCTLSAVYENGAVEKLYLLCENCDFDRISEYILTKYNFNCTKK